ncbi:MAG: glycosyltransferase family 39 protein, partial [Planctomycetes bacterium]|nr:glycosyltransferase family 39 protein [Planctomycetota bacterium]
MNALTPSPMTPFSRIDSTASVVVIAAIVMVLLHVIMLAATAVQLSPSDGEVPALAAGMRHCLVGDFHLFRVNPPLVRTIGALPVALCGAEVDWRAAQGTGRNRPEVDVGRDFVRANGERSLWLFTIARWACIPFSIVGAAVCYCWARSLYGHMAGWLAVGLWCLCPYILAYSPMISADAPAAALGAGGGFCLWRWLRVPSVDRAVWVGATFGVAALAKATWIPLGILLPFLTMCWFCAYGNRRLLADAMRYSAQSILALAVALCVINLGYGFQGSFKSLGDYQFVCSTLNGGLPSEVGSAPTGNRFRGTMLECCPVPLPEDCVLGIDTQKRDFEIGKFSYLRGRWADHGWCYYYLYALAVKVPLGTWALVLLAVVVTVLGQGFNAASRDEIVVLVPGLAILVFVSSQTGFSVHSRYVIPALPFFFVWISKVARVFEMRPLTQVRRAVAALVVVALVWSATSSLWASPHSLSYFNELVGGPRHGGKHLLGSNIDWGQDLLYLKDWLDEHPDATLDGLAFYGSYPATLAGIPETPYPTPGPECEYDSANRHGDRIGPKPGWYALSVNHLYDRSRQYRHFLRFQPVAMAGYSIYIYHVTLD